MEMKTSAKVRLPEYLAANERKALAALVDRLHQRYGENLLRVVLFGSKARGDFGDESDLDLLVVVRMHGDTFRQHWREIVDIAWESEFAYGVAMSLIIKSEEAYEAMCRHNLLLHRNIQQDGIPLWTKRQDEAIFAPA